MSANPKVLYLFGAGASANALPMVKDIPARLEAHAQYLSSPQIQQNLTAGFNTTPALPFRSVLDQYLGDIRKLKEMAKVHESIDTYAKKLYLKGPKYMEELFRLKVALSMFLAYNQAKYADQERRYDGFFASVLSNSSGLLRIPDEILILNWNYDQMLGHAFKEYTQSGQFHECHTQLGVVPLHDVSPLEPYSVVHLNGLFAYQEVGKQFHPIVSTASSQDREITEDLLRYFYRAHLKTDDPICRNPDAHLMQFAWETNAMRTSAFDQVLERLHDVTALVVIGYSFPFFNREFDRKILKWAAALQRIYVQAPPGAAEDIGRTIKSMGVGRGVGIEYYTNTEKFLLPREL